MKRMTRIMSLLLGFSMVVSCIPVSVFGEDISQIGMCEHHQEHTGCSYAAAVEAMDCSHQHGEDCSALEEQCIHIHEDCGVEEALCTHECSEESGCLRKVLNCQHRHDETCGYAESQAAVVCDYTCAECNYQDADVECDGTMDCAAEEHNEVCDKETAEKQDEEVMQIDNGAHIHVFNDHHQCTCGVIGGACGENLTWTFDDETGTLTIFGTGDMDGYSSSDENTPWSCFANDILSIVVEEGVNSIGTYVFHDCTVLNSVVLPESLTLIDWGAFAGCSSLSNIEIPENVTEISGSTFHSCDALTSISIPTSVTFIDPDAFAGCDNLSGIWVDKDNTKYANDSYGVLFNKDMTQLVKYPEGLSGEYTIPNGVITIGMDAFMSSQNLTGVTFSDTVTEISDSGFIGCNSLKNIVIPSTITIIDSMAFAFCGSLESITFEGNVPSLSDIVFVETTTTAYYPANNHTWTPDVLQDYGGNITWVGYNGESTYSGICGDDLNWTFNKENRKLSVTGTGEMYGADKLTWTAFSEEIQSVEINSGATSIGAYAFYDCNKLTGIEIPDTVMDIAYNAFENCSSLKEVEIPESVMEISYGAFMDCTSLNSVVLPENLRSIGDHAFDNCTRLNEIALPRNLRSIGDHAFSYCHNLTELELPANLTTIRTDAFKNCSGLKEVYFTGNAPKIQDNTFFNVWANAYYPAGNHTWTSDALQNYGGNLTWVGYNGESTYSGICGDDLNWTFNKETRKLSVTGTGEMYGADKLNWTAFSEEIRSVEINSGATSIGAYAFYDCSELTDVKIPSTVMDIAYNAFESCSSLQTIKVPENVMEISYGTFKDCTSLASVELPENLRSVGNHAFSYCHNLTEMELPANLTTIRADAFKNCSSLKEVYFTGNAPEIQNNAFYNVQTKAFYPKGNSTWTSDVLKNYGGKITWIAQEESEAEYTYSQNVQIKLIEPWGIRANAKISTAEGVVDYNQLYDYGVYFIRKSALDREGLSQSTITVEDIVNDADAQKQTKADGVTVSSGYLSAIYDRDIYTYELEDSVFVMFYFVTEEGTDPIYVPIRERNLEELVQQRKNDAASFPNELERTVYQKMTKLEEDVADYRSDFANLSAPETQKAPTLAQYPLGPQAAGSQYTYGQNAQIKLIEPWGLKANVKVSQSGSVIDYNAVEEYGIVALADNSRTYADASEILQNQNAYVFSSKNGDASISNGYISATYSKDIFTYQLNTDIYVFGYVKDADGYHYGPVRNRNVHTLMEARMNDAVNFPNLKERTVYADMIDLYTAITAYREDYFKN